MKPEQFISDELRADYSNTKYEYSNQTMIQLTSEDVEIVFGDIRLDNNGAPYKNISNAIRISHIHFEKFVETCNIQIENLKKLKELDGK